MICQNVKKINRIVEDHKFVAKITTGDGGMSKMTVNMPIDKIVLDVWFLKKKNHNEAGRVLVIRLLCSPSKLLRCQEFA